MSEILATVNAPGEIGGWFLPLAEQVKALSPAATIRAVLTPCPFASGREREVLQRSTAVDDVVDLWPFVRRALRLRRRFSTRACDGRIVLHLGGDRAYALLLARLLAAPAWVYGTSAHWSRRFDRCLVPDERTLDKLVARGVNRERVLTVGELVLDSVPASVDPSPVVERLGLDAGSDEIVALMAGSRPYEIDFMLPFYAGLLDTLAATRPRVQCLLPWSGFVDDAVARRALAGSGARWEGDSATPRLVTAAGAVGHVVRENAISAMKAARLAVTLPGTNTLQLAALGTPMLVIVPLNTAENIVVEGPVNWLSPRWPPTRALKRTILFRMNERLRFVALPNLIAGEEVVPEFRAVMSPEEVGQRVARLLDDVQGRRQMSARLIGLAGARGAARRMAMALTET